MNLNLLIAIPALGFLAALFLPKSAARLLALVTTIATFVLSLGLVASYDMAKAGLQFASDVVWIPNPEIHWHVAVDGLSLWLIVLSAFLGPVAVLTSWKAIADRAPQFYAFLLLLEAGLIGVFVAQDLFVYYLFWEIVLVPICLIIGMWGGERRVYASTKFFLYTNAGSVLMLAAIIFLYNKVGSFDYVTVLSALQTGRVHLTGYEETLLFLGFFAAMAIKVPIFPFHTWLPDAYAEAPAGGSVLLAAVMGKMGTYGLVRFCLPMFPNAVRENAGWIVVLAIIGIIYGALVAMVQPNFKRLIAYSSVSHLGFVVLGIFSCTRIGLDGAVYQMVAHGVTTGALFVLASFLFERRASHNISDFGGICKIAPWFTTIFLIASLASIGLPLLNNFVGEFLILQGAAQANFTWAVFASIGVILSACYMLWMVQRVFLGETNDGLAGRFPDLNMREWACLVPLAVLMVWMGVYTQTFLPAIGASNSQILEKMNVPLRVSNPVSGGSVHAR